MKWISVKDSLPMQAIDGFMKMPEPEPVPTMDWCIVTSARQGTGEQWPVAIARYDGKRWEFYETYDVCMKCPSHIDGASSICIDEITHWMRIEIPGG